MAAATYSGVYGGSAASRSPSSPREVQLYGQVVSMDQAILDCQAAACKNEYRSLCSAANARAGLMAGSQTRSESAQRRWSSDQPLEQAIASQTPLQTSTFFPPESPQPQTGTSSLFPPQSPRPQARVTMLPPPPLVKQASSLQALRIAQTPPPPQHLQRTQQEVGHPPPPHVLPQIQLEASARWPVGGQLKSMNFLAPDNLTPQPSARSFTPQGSADGSVTPQANPIFSLQQVLRTRPPQVLQSVKQQQQASSVACSVFKPSRLPYSDNRICSDCVISSRFALNT